MGTLERARTLGDSGPSAPTATSARSSRKTTGTSTASRRTTGSRAWTWRPATRSRSRPAWNTGWGAGSPSGPASPGARAPSRRPGEPPSIPIPGSASIRAAPATKARCSPSGTRIRNVGRLVFDVYRSLRHGRRRLRLGAPGMRTRLPGRSLGGGRRGRIRLLGPAQVSISSKTPVFLFLRTLSQGRARPFMAT